MISLILFPVNFGLEHAVRAATRGFDEEVSYKISLSGITPERTEHSLHQESQRSLRELGKIQLRRADKRESHTRANVLRPTALSSRRRSGVDVRGF